MYLEEAIAFVFKKPDAGFKVFFKFLHSAHQIVQQKAAKGSLGFHH